MSPRRDARPSPDRGTQIDTQAVLARPAIRRIGRRRVVSGEQTAGEHREQIAQTRDDTDAGWGTESPQPDKAESGSRDEWLRNEVPPHWG